MMPLFMKQLTATQKKKSLLFKSLIPGLIGITLLIIQTVLQTLFLHSNIVNPKINATLNPTEDWPFEALKSIHNVLETMKVALFDSYNNYLAFMLMMLLVNSLFQGLAFLRSLLSKERWTKLLQSSSFFYEKAQQIFMIIIKNIMIYSLLYCFYQVFWTSLSLFLPSSGAIMIQALHEQAPQSFHEVNSPEKLQINANQIIKSERILEENSSLIIIATASDELTRNMMKPSLSIGRILSEIDIEAFSITLSKDEKIAFVVGRAILDSALFIIDISNLEFPTVLTSCTLLTMNEKTLILSSDETKLYITNGKILEVFDISDLRAPERISEFTDSDRSSSSTASVLISKDDRFLFVNGFGLRIYDISKPSAPVIVNSLQSSSLRSSINLSPDEKTLYYTNGTLWIYDASDPMNLKIQGSFSPKYSINSLVLLSDAKTAYFTVTTTEKKRGVQKIDLLDVTSIKENSFIELGRESTANCVFRGKSPNDRLLFMDFKHKVNAAQVLPKMAVFDTIDERFSTHDKLFTIDAISVFVMKDSKKILFGSGTTLKILELYLGFPNRNSFTESSNILQTFDSFLDFATFTLAPSNESLIFGATNEILSNGKTSLTIQSLDLNSEYLNVIDAIAMDDGNITGMQISGDSSKAYWISSLKTATIYDITSIESITLWRKYKRDAIESYSLFDFLLSKDGKTGYLSYSANKNNIVEIVDFSTLTKKASIKIEQEFGCLKLSKDEGTLFIAGQMLAIYNITSPGTPVLKANMALFAKGLGQGKNEMILSQDETTLFINEKTSSSLYTLRVVEVSNLTFPKIKSEFRIPLLTQSSNYKGRTIEVSPDSNQVYIMRDGDLVVIDVSSRSSPRYLGTIKTNSNDSFVDFKLCKNGEKGYLVTQNSKFHVFSTQAVYSTYLVEDKLMLGERYHIDVRVLALEKNMGYNAILEDYRFTKFFLVEPRSIQSAQFANVTLMMPPYWMNFDFKSQILTVEPRRKNDIQTYRIYCAFSKKIVTKKISEAGLVSNENKLMDLVAILIGQGYLDNQLFLTGNFGELEEFVLPSEYEGVRKPLYQLLKQYSFGTFNEINVVSSLNLTTDSGKLNINTLNPASLKVDISLKGQAQFLYKYYGSLHSSIISEKSRIILEGSLNEVNLALKELVINLKGHTCDGQIIVDDKLNPIMNVSVKDIARCFEKNQEPRENKEFPLTLQEQVNRHTVQTGQYFQIKFDPKTFSDDYTLVENLNYQVIFITKDNSEHTLPNWVTFSDTTLSGVAPETIVDREYKFVLVVKNEFRHLNKQFTLSVGISPLFALKILAKYSPYILSVLGLIIFLNKIYNVVAKRRYKHPRELYLPVGEEITPEVIFPISFIAQERRVAKKILELLKKENFIIDGSVDKERLVEKTKECCEAGASEKKNSLLGSYLKGNECQKQTINQVIFNHFVMKQLSLKEEKETKKYFDKIKKQWTKLVQWDSGNSEFKINEKQFDEILALQGFNKEEKPEKMSEGEELLLKYYSEINLELLKNAVLAYAFDQQNINELPVKVICETKEKISANFFKRFLKRDLANSPFQKGNRLGYGLRYKTNFNRIYFYGSVEKDFQDKTIIFQIKTLKQKILKEFWIHSADRQQEVKEEKGQIPEQSFRTVSELEARGKEYETF